MFEPGLNNKGSPCKFKDFWGRAVEVQVVFIFLRPDNASFDVVRVLWRYFANEVVDVVEDSHVFWCVGLFK
jgi:hypothetical protein